MTEMINVINASQYAVLQSSLGKRILSCWTLQQDSREGYYHIRPNSRECQGTRYGNSIQPSILSAEDIEKPEGEILARACTTCPIMTQAIAAIDEHQLRDFVSSMSPPEILDVIERIAVGLSDRGFLPNNLQQLIFGSISARMQILFYETGANQGYYTEDQKPEFDSLWKGWVASYDGYSGENLAGTALYQHNRYAPQDERFPEPNTPEYAQLVEEMAILGHFARELGHKQEFRVITSAFFDIDSRLKEKLRPSS